MAWLSDKKRISYCSDCPKRGYECGGCEWGLPPELWEINRDALDLWRAVLTQFRSSGFGVVGLDYVAVKQQAELMDIELDFCTMRKIQALELWFINKTGEEHGG